MVISRRSSDSARLCILKACPILPVHSRRIVIARDRINPCCFITFDSHFADELSFRASRSDTRCHRFEHSISPFE